MPGGLGIASAIEPAGGVSPLRGGAGIWYSWSCQPKVVANYRGGIFINTLKTIGRGDRFTVQGVTVSPSKGDRFTVSRGDRFTVDNFINPQAFQDVGRAAE